MKASAVFFGTSPFAHSVRDALNSAGYNIVAGVPPANDVPEADFFVIASYGKILRQETLKRARLGVLNVHPSLLPKYRGPTPVPSAILAGEKETGVTIMLTDELVDHGPILAQKKVLIGPQETAEELLVQLFQEGARLLIEILPDWLSGKLTPVPQRHEDATYTKRFMRDDGKIDWSKPPDYIERFVRAMTPWPSAWTVHEGMRVKILKAHVEGNILIPDLVQPEGRTQMTYAEFKRGYQDFILKGDIQKA